MTVGEFLKRSFAVDHGYFLNVRSQSHMDGLAYRCTIEHVRRVYGGRTFKSVRPEISWLDGGLFPTMTITIA